jgi:hypothetical protein
MEQLRCDGTESLDPKIWSELPYDLVRHILGFCDIIDIDTRRAFGLKPRRNRLPIFDLKIQPLIWGEYRCERFPGVFLVCDIKKNSKKLVGKFITSTDVHHVVWDSHTWHIVT